MTKQSGESKKDKAVPESAVPSRKRRYTAEISHVNSDRHEGAPIELDENGFITLWSREAEQLYGYDYEEIIGKHLSSLYCEGELEQGRAAYELNAMNTRRTYNVFGWQLRKGGDCLGKSYVDQQS